MVDVYKRQELSKRGYKVGTIKHTHHDFDLEGKDTWKHREAGAKIVVGSGKGTFFFINKLLSVSYTHLDVYKRQHKSSSIFIHSY